MWRLTRAWYHDRLDPTFLPAAIGDLQRFLADAELTDPFWQLRV